MSELQARMESQYDFTADEKGDEFVAIKTGDDFPYRVRKDGGVWVLAQSFSARSWLKPSFKQIGIFLSRDSALERIVKRHNKSCKHMANWSPI